MNLLIYTIFSFFIISCSEVEFDLVEIEKIVEKVLFSGSYDTDFGDDGRVYWDASTGGADNSASNVQDSQGNIYLAGYVTDPTHGTKDIAVWKFNSNGQIDDTFANSTGVFTYNNDSEDGNDEAYSITIDSQDRLVVTGYSTGSSRARMIVLRLSLDGEIDTSFATSGAYIYSHPSAGASEGERGRCLFIDSRDRIIVGGQGYYNNDKSLKVWALDDQGQVDTSFGSSGLYQIHGVAGGGGADKVIDCTQSEDRIIIGGYSWAGSSAGRHKVFVGALDLDGNLDTSFGESSGFTFFDDMGGLANKNDTLYAIALDDENNIYLLGKTYNPANVLDAFIAKVSKNGITDNSFGTSGYIIKSNLAGGNGADQFLSAQYIDHKDTLYIVGNSYDSSAMKSFIYAIDKSGAEVEIVDGMALHLFEQIRGASESLNDISFKNEKLVISGGSNNGVDNDLHMLRFY